MWPGPLPGSLPVSALPLVSPVQGNVKGKFCFILCDFFLFLEIYAKKNYYTYCG